MEMENKLGLNPPIIFHCSPLTHENFREKRFEQRDGDKYKQDGFSADTFQVVIININTFKSCFFADER